MSLCKIFGERIDIRKLVQSDICDRLIYFKCNTRNLNIADPLTSITAKCIQFILIQYNNILIK